ncbi:S8 family peptidase [Streptomyces sp. NPDC048566]|uniref:S8 family peptidase n=1 Tax=Streptomyces sp. NPDC048566 TaxID=3365569 RepID=UPI003722598F
MARSAKRRKRRGAALAAAVTAVVLSAAAPPSPASAEGRVLGAGGPGSVSGSYIVTLAEGTRAASPAGAALAAAYGVRVVHTYGSALNGFAVRTGAGRARRLAADPRVASVVQDTRVVPQEAQKDPPSWGLDRIDQRARPLDRRYAAPAAAGAGVTVYVIDTGVRLTHRDFGGRASSGWDFVDGDRTAQDGNGHGTQVAATAVGSRYGVAKRARVVAVRVLDDHGAGTTAQVIAGIDWVTRHARKPAVANLSLGGRGNARLDAAVRASIASGVTYTVAAGNGGLPAGRFSPGRVREAVTVGASDRGDARAAFSDTGPAVDLFAPGVAITSASSAGDTAHVAGSGTSMASPHVAGAAALYLSGHPRAAPGQVAAALVKLAVPGKLSDVGPGSPNKLLNVG